jgi:hypothetical protein
VALGDHPDRRDPGVLDRHLRADAGVRLLAQHADLFGLVLAIGIVVDDAIVVVENVERNIALGLSPRQAAPRPWTRSARRSSPSRWC